MRLESASSFMSSPSPNLAPADSPADRAPSEAAVTEPPFTIIEARSGWQPIDLAELWHYRELLYFLVWRDVKVRYKQTALGIAWAILQPTLMMVVFTLVLGRIRGKSLGDIPYPLFAYAGFLPWTFFATAISTAGQSVVTAERLITKVYFPRLAIPLSAIGAALLDFALASLVLAAIMAWYRIAPGPSLLLAPALVALLALAAAGVGILLAALNVAYRDVRHALPFLVQLWLFATPAIYLQPATVEHSVRPAAATSSDSLITENEAMEQTQVDAEAEAVQSGGFRLLSLNPLEGLITFFRCAVLNQPLPWRQLAYPAILIPCLLAVGSLYFRRVEDSFADII